MLKAVAAWTLVLIDTIYIIVYTFFIYFGWVSEWLWFCVAFVAFSAGLFVWALAKTRGRSITVEGWGRW